MSGDNPVIRFSPFEALFIGEKNKIVKRKPSKNTIFVSQLSHQSKSFNLRELFDLNDGNGSTDEESLFKKPERVSDYLRKKLCHVSIENKKKCKSKSGSKKFRFEFEKRNLVVKKNALIKCCNITKKTQSNKVRFKRDFKYKETLEERIVNKIQKRRKKLRRNLNSNGLLKLDDKTKYKHCLRGKDGKFIRKEEFESMMNENSDNPEFRRKYLSYYLRYLYRNKTRDPSTTRPAEDPPVRDGPNGFSKRIKLAVNGSDVSKQYYKRSISSKVEFPPVPDGMEIVDFEDDKSLMDIVCESRRTTTSGSEESSDGGGGGSCGGKGKGGGGEELENEEILRKRKGLKMYERKKPKPGCGMREIFNNNMKENRCLNKSSNPNDLDNVSDRKSISKGRRNGMNYLIDERPAKGNQLISKNKLRSLFYKTACGSETYLGNITKPVLLNSTFGRLPDIV